MFISPDVVDAVILPDAAYHLSAVKRQFGIGENALRQMRQRGLKVRRSGRRSFIIGRDLIAEIEQHGRIVE
jgi:hypothetical protein